MGCIASKPAKQQVVWVRRIGDRRPGIAVPTLIFLKSDDEVVSILIHQIELRYGLQFEISAIHSSNDKGMPNMNEHLRVDELVLPHLNDNNGPDHPLWYEAHNYRRNNGNSTRLPITTSRQPATLHSSVSDSDF